uniref:Uncharacterized protein n=1 Tax=Ditylenchus dipsaci TaxID=166011 RepID=A0A915EDF0_9BILA
MQKRPLKKEAEHAYKEWLKESVKKVSAKAQKVIESEKEQGDIVKKEKEYKDELAQEAYRLWLEMKKEEENYAHSLAYKILEYESEAKKRWPSTPWLPNGNTVPRRFIGHGNRRKTIEKPLVLKYSAKRTQSVH